jgi:colicin import membrane protein
MYARARWGWTDEWGVPVLGAFLVHVAVAFLASATLSLPLPKLTLEPKVIDAEIIDARVIDAEARRLREAREAEQRAAAAAIAAKKAREVEHELAVAAAAAAVQAEKRRARDTEVAKARKAQLKREHEASAQVERESELQQSLAAEERRSKLLRSPALQRYKDEVAQKVERNWIRPATLPANLDCLVAIEQLPTGDVVRAEVVSCNGDESVRRSIESAVLRASPLPLPSDRSLWDRIGEFHFKPESKK